MTSTSGTFDPLDIVHISKMMNGTGYCCKVYGSSIPKDLEHTKAASAPKDGLLQRLFHELVRDHTEAGVHGCQPHTREPLPLKMTYYKDYFMSLSELTQRLQYMLHSAHKAIGQLRVSSHQQGIEAG